MSSTGMTEESPCNGEGLGILRRCAPQNDTGAAHVVPFGKLRINSKLTMSEWGAQEDPLCCGLKAPRQSRDVSN